MGVDGESRIQMRCLVKKKKKGLCSTILQVMILHPLPLAWNTVGDLDGPQEECWCRIFFPCPYPVS